LALLIRGGCIVDPTQGIHEVGDIWIDKGRIHRIVLPSRGDSAAAPGPKDEVIEAKGLTVIPGIVDMHVHLREPGYEYKETIATGTRAAAAGGVTTVACMANTKPANDQGAVCQFILAKAQKEGVVRVRPIGAISRGLEGAELAEIGELKESGAVAISDDGRPVADSLLMRRAMEYARTFGLPVISHCEDPHLAANGVMNEGLVSLELGLRGIPRIAEEVMVARDLLLAEWTGCRLHIAHVSSAGSVRLIREAKERGVAVTAEVTPHHLILTDEAVRRWDTNTKVNPPLRSPKDVEALHQGLADGTLDAIATDHAPHGRVDKEVEYELAAFGISGLETLLGLSLMLVHQGTLSLEDWVRKVSCNPAKILNIPGGTLKPGVPADLTIINMERSWRVDPEAFFSKGRNTPFHGWTLRGKAVMTFIGGRKVFHESEGILATTDASVCL
jgi:dihydroorotase